MKTLKRIKLNRLNDAELFEREMSDLRGGKVCGCGCNFADSGGSSIAVNGVSNVDIGSDGGHSSGGNKQCFIDISGSITGTVDKSLGY